MKNACKKDSYRRAVDMIGYALTLRDDVGIWIDLATVLECRLTPYERCMLLVSVTKSCDPDDALEVFGQAASEWLCGPPLPVFDDIDADARWWADLATIPELKAWLAAVFVRLPERDRQEFLAAATRRAVA